MKAISRSRSLDPAAFGMGFPARILIRGWLCVGLLLAPGFRVQGAVHAERGTQCRLLKDIAVTENENMFFDGGAGPLRARAPGSFPDPLLLCAAENAPKNGSGNGKKPPSTPVKKKPDYIMAIVTQMVVFDVASRPLWAVPAGSFEMGLKTDSEAPLHTVNLPKFFMGETEVTYMEWVSVRVWADKNGYTFDNGGSCAGVFHPVTNVSWYDVVKWCNAKSEMERLTPLFYTGPEFEVGSVYRAGQVSLLHSMVNWSANGYRLPTEAEWEKAARGGLKGRLYPNGDKLSKAGANFDNNAVGTVEVKQYAPNGFGLYDMAGNMWEWCWDWYAPRYEGSGEDPHGPLEGGGVERIIRGGGWGGTKETCQVAARDADMPEMSGGGLGFRIVRR